jgi:hypothetical protein
VHVGPTRRSRELIYRLLNTRPVKRTTKGADQDSVAIKKDQSHPDPPARATPDLECTARVARSTIVFAGWFASRALGVFGHQAVPDSGVAPASDRARKNPLLRKPAKTASDPPGTPRSGEPGCVTTFSSKFHGANSAGRLPPPRRLVKPTMLASPPDRKTNICMPHYMECLTGGAIESGSSRLSNELLGLNHEPRLDTGAAGGTHLRLETVGAVQWPEN